jgi:hypothetical protein
MAMLKRDAAHTQNSGKQATAVYPWVLRPVRPYDFH